MALRFSKLEPKGDRKARQRNKTRSTRTCDSLGCFPIGRFINKTISIYIHIPWSPIKPRDLEQYEKAAMELLLPAQLLHLQHQPLKAEGLTDREGEAKGGFRLWLGLLFQFLSCSGAERRRLLSSNF